MSEVAYIDKNIRQTSDGITVRRMNFDFDDTLREFWCDDNPVLTAFLTALSVSFPAGERFFIDSVRHYEAQLKQSKNTSPALLADIRAFIGQEAHHTVEHQALNGFMERKGYPIRKMESFIAERINMMQKSSAPEVNLARTVALEHFTAIMAAGFLSHPQLMDKMDPEMAALWGWHAIEEIEHRAVAFDVYQEVVGDDALRRRTMRTITYFFILMNTIRTLRLLKVSGNRFHLKAWGKAANTLWGYPGVLRKIVPQYFSYYRKGFHPSQHDVSEIVAAAKKKYLKDA